MFDVVEELSELLGGDGVEKVFAAVEVVIDGHGGDGHGFGYPTHGDGLSAFFFEDIEGGGGDAVSGVDRRFDQDAARFSRGALIGHRYTLYSN
jgi:hypothetical protein